MRQLLSTLSVLTALTLHAQPPSYVPTNGLVGWWPFNGNANDESGNGNNGTVNGATLTQDRNGLPDAAYNFNGTTDFISVPDNNSLDIENNYTLSAWINIPDYSVSPSQPNSFGVTDDTRTVFGKPRNSGWATGYNINTYPTGQSTILGTSAANMSCCPSIGIGGFQVPPLNTWTHAIVTYNGIALNLYVNGVLDNSVQVSYILDNSSQPLLIGKEFVSVGDNWYRWFKGAIDDIGIWNRALTPAEIQDLYLAGQPPTPCVSPDPVSFTGLGSSYTQADPPVTLTGTPAGGVFIGPGVTGGTFDPAAAGVGVHSIQYVYVDGNDCVNAAGQCTEVTVNAGVGGSNMTTGGVRVFPNPNRGQFTVELELNGLVGMQVFDARGALVHNEVFTASGSRTQRTLDLSAFAKGSYTLLVDHDGQRVSQTVVVE